MIEHDRGLRRDKAGKGYWDERWAKGAMPRPLDPFAAGLGHHVDRALHAYFARALAGIHPGESLIEVGCAGSVRLPYFARFFGLRVAGLDYSEVGCLQATEILASAGVKGDIYCADMFQPPQELIGRFGVVFSFGLVEHFQPTSDATRSLARFLRPGGHIITVVPNLCGVPGMIQRALNRPVFDIHVPLEKWSLRAAHEAAELVVARCEYLMSTHFGVLNLSGLPEDWSTRVKARVLLNLRRASKLAWAFEEHVGPLPATKAFAPYLACVARRPL